MRLLFSLYLTSNRFGKLSYLLFYFTVALSFLSFFQYSFLLISFFFLFLFFFLIFSFLFLFNFYWPQMKLFFYLYLNNYKQITGAIIRGRGTCSTCQSLNLTYHKRTRCRHGYKALWYVHIPRTDHGTCMYHSYKVHAHIP